jgi:hypothetical protein
MTFFQDYSIPVPPPRPRTPQFTPPPWAAPPRYELPAVVPVNQFIYRSHDFALAIEAIKVHSTGCTIDVNWILRRTDQEDRKWAEINAVFLRPAPQVRDGGISAGSVLLFGVQFPDGTKASSSSLAMYGPRSMDQEPDGPVFEYRPKGGTGGEDDISARGALWLWPLPPAGDLRLVTQWTDMGMGETSTKLDGTQLREAAARAQKYWEHEDGQG